MKKLLEFLVKQPLFLNLITLFLLIAGVTALYRMNRDLLPTINYDTVIITTAYDGAAPKEVEKLITIPLEKELKEVDDIKEMTSASIENFSIIVMELAPDADDKSAIITDIQRAVDRTADLPADLKDPPTVREVKSKDIPIIEISLSGDMSEAELQKHAKIIEDSLLDMPEISAVIRKGWREKEIWVEVSPESSAQYHIALSEVMRALALRNVERPSGKLVQKGEEFLIRTVGEFETAKEIESVIVRSNDAGSLVKAGDIAKVSESFEDEQVIYKTNGFRAINLVAVKRESADAIDMVDKIKKMVAAYEASDQSSLKIDLVNDHSYYIKRRLNVLTQNGFVGIILVVVVLFLFLDARMAFVTSVGVPIAFLATFFAMKSFGMTINLISMFGLIMVCGMLVDQAVVISENTFRHIENGLSFKEAAVKGTLEVWRPVTSSVLTTIAAFIPLMFMTGIMGKFIWSIPVVVTIALIVSLLIAIFILPSQMAQMERFKFTRVHDILFTKKPQQWLKKFIGWYERVLIRALKRKYRIFTVVVFLIAAAVLLAKFFMPVVIFPARGIDLFFVRAKLPVGTPLEETEQKFRLLEKIISQIPESEMNDFVTNIGVTQNDPNDPFTQRASHVGQISVFLKPETDRKRTTKEIIADLRQKSKNINGFEEISFDEVTPGPPIGKPVAIRLRGDDLDKLDMLAEDLKTELKKMKGVIDVKDDYEEGKSELRVIVNEESATKAGLQVNDVAAALKNSFEGSIATTIKKADEEISVRVKFPYDVKYKKESLDKVLVPNARGDLIPLSKVASFETKPGISSIRHLDRRRVVTVTANIDQKQTTSLGVSNGVLEKFSDFSQKNPGYSLSFGGEFEETSKSLASLFSAFILAVFLIFIIMATDFRSLIHPLVVMMTVPFGLFGVIVAFWFHGMPLSFLSLLGSIGLAGVVVNSAIVLIDFINHRRMEGMERDKAIIEAGKIRMRPIFLTVITTVFGVFPTAYGLWGSDPILIPAAMALMWGLIFATLLTLIVIPCFYAIADDLMNKFGIIDKFRSES